jgi:hypothetical protein
MLIWFFSLEGSCCWEDGPRLLQRLEPAAIWLSDKTRMRSGKVDLRCATLVDSCFVLAFAFAQDQSRHRPYLPAFRHADDPD